MPKFGQVKVFQVVAHKAYLALDELRSWCEDEGIDTDEVNRMMYSVIKMASLDSFTPKGMDEFLSSFDDNCLELVSMVSQSIKNDPSGKNLYECLASGFFLEEIDR